MSVIGVQRDATRNQSTVDITKKNIFTYGNRYREATFSNNTGASLTVDSGILVLRHATLADTIIPAIAGATLANVIGILFINGPVTLADAGTASANYCIFGDVDGGLLTLPAGVTLDTMVGAKAVKDILTDLGIVPNMVSEISKTNN